VNQLLSQKKKEAIDLRALFLSFFTRMGAAGGHVPG
jgi:hypothetical protein